MKILYAASEAAPFAKTGGLGDVAGSLPVALAERGHDVRVILPLYSSMDYRLRQKMQFRLYTYVFLSWRRQYCGLFELKDRGVTYYFIDNEYYFARERLYGHYDDGERFAFFSRAVVHLLPLLDWRPDVIHANDWQTALIPIYLRHSASADISSIKSVFTIHNIEYQGIYGAGTMSDLFGLPSELFTGGQMECDGCVNLMKGAIYHADALTTVSPTYAKELCLPEYAHGLHDIIKANSHKLTGIVNGIDLTVYDPSTDEAICAPFSAEDMSGKAKCKEELQRTLGLRPDPKVPVIACVSRLVSHKGFDLVLDALEDIMSRNVQFVVLGTGEWSYEQQFSDAQSRYQGRLDAHILYSGALASRIYAGADIFLMPSKSEPCGLAQMIAMRYGTLPVVRSTGGLRDTVVPYGEAGANGFAFEEYTAEAMLAALDSALRVYGGEEWKKLRDTAMKTDFSWKKSADKYISLYSELIGD